MLDSPPAPEKYVRAAQPALIRLSREASALSAAIHRHHARRFRPGQRKAGVLHAERIEEPLLQKLIERLA